MASVNTRQTRTAQRKSAGRSVTSSDNVIVFESDLPDSKATYLAEGDGVEALRGEIARLELLRRHLQKDIGVKDAYLAALRGDLRTKEREITALRESIAGLHEHISRTLSQPRYRAVDALNAALRRIVPLHTLLKRWLVRQPRLDPPSANSPS